MIARVAAALAAALLVTPWAPLHADAAADSAFAAATDTIRVPIRVSVPADTLDLGRVFDARVQLLHPGLSRVQLLVGERGLEPLEVAGVRRELDTGDTTNVRLSLRAFRVGDVVAPPVVMAALTEDGALAIGRSDSLRVTVASVVPADAENIRDIHDAVALDPPFPWLTWAIVLLALGLVAMLVLLLRRRRHASAAAVGVRITPAHELAIDALRALEASPVARDGVWKAYYTELSDILRTYLARRFGIDAPDMTSSQTLRAVNQLDVAPDATLALKHVLFMADRVKFAKDTPPEDAPSRHVAEAMTFVRATAHRSAPAADPEPAVEVAS